MRTAPLTVRFSKARSRRPNQVWAHATRFSGLVGSSLERRRTVYLEGMGKPASAGTVIEVLRNEFRALARRLERVPRPCRYVR
ncbi:MAG TPA: hypothetical protein VN857_05405 [Chthoniobacterales bacterium]|jgi:hypothetical protein|nr:hypothetical protein [Chthoniobacterales bacterium]